MELRPATQADIPSIVSLFRQSFSGPDWDDLFPLTEGCDAFLRQGWSSFVSAGNVIVVADSSEVKALTLYFHEKHGPTPWTTRWPAPPAEGMSQDLLKEFFEGMDKQHKIAMKEAPHTCNTCPYPLSKLVRGLTGSETDLEVVMTHPSARRQGLGSKLVAHVVKEAGEKPTYLDSERDTVGMYEKLGFEILGEEIWMSEMMRPMLHPGRK